VPTAQAATMGLWFVMLKLRLVQAFSEWTNLGLITPADLAMVGSWTTVERPPPTVTTEKRTWQSEQFQRSVTSERRSGPTF
jgi:hypothetical protein